ncbi:hypothetical protein HN014_01305 [Aquimarina sp. TRL1]|uniref:hypothetical protein n=1 Tax=Aquimarina sp. (strain TRL1) TaxID=2736252 RepID=UPI0015899EAD|nr:hypothetical protein [Aquimarina sp. TRL1]QKX03605.1 hypothetical protein HN014_01305 [Aquimarina sp. TRL1]
MIKKISLAILGGLIIIACETDLEIQKTNRKDIAADFRLLEVQDDQENVIESYVYGNKQELTKVRLRGSDLFNLRYQEGKINTINKRTVHITDDGYIVVWGDDTEVQLEKKATSWRINYLQKNEEGVMVISDYLDLFFDDNTNIVRSYLHSHNRNVFYFYDSMLTPYHAIQEEVLICLLNYPLPRMEENITRIISNNNVVRISKLPKSEDISTTIEYNGEIQELTYRYIHPLYDVPVKKNIFPGKKQSFTYKYNQ